MSSSLQTSVYFVYTYGMWTLWASASEDVFKSVICLMLICKYVQKSFVTLKNWGKKKLNITVQVGKINTSF